MKSKKKPLSDSLVHAMKVRRFLIMSGITLFSIKMKMGDMVAQTWEKVVKMEKDIEEIKKLLKNIQESLIK